MRLIRFGRRTVDLAARLVLDGSDPNSGSGPIHLTPREARLLRYLAERPNQLVSREELLAEVWSYQPGVITRTIDNTVRRLRVKLEDDASNPRFLHSRYGRGLQLEGAEVVSADDDGASFVGRQDAMARILALLHVERCVTITGPGGIGKTRLAREASARLATDVVTVSCAVRTPTDLDDQLRLALGTAGAPDLEPLRARGPVVVVLDECEAVAAAVARRVSEWIAGAPGVRVLATSRIPLGSSAEVVVALDPLPRDAATALFTERMDRRQPRPEADVDAVDRVVGLLDGLPLAIELAAARVPTLGLDGLAALLASPLDALVAGGRSMADVLERSWELCTAGDRRTLSELSVFCATFGLDDLAAVTGVDAQAAARAIDALCAQSLVEIEAQPGGKPVRYRLLAAIRQRAAQDLADDDPVHLRAARHFARLGDPERIERGRSDRSLFDAIRFALADLGRALERLAPVDADAASRCVLAMLWWMGRGMPGQGAELPDRLLAPPPSSRVAAGIALYHAIAMAAASRFQRVCEDLQDALLVADDPYDRMSLYVSLAAAKWNVGDRAGLDDALDAARPLFDRARGARARWLHRSAVFSPDPAAADALLVRAAAEAHEHGDVLLGADIQGEIAERTHLRNGDWDAARRAYRRVLDAVGPDGWSHPVVHRHTLVSLGRLEQLVGHLDAAEAHLEHALEVQTRDEPITARLILCRVWSQRRHHEEALTLIELVTSGSLPAPAQPYALACIIQAEVLLRANREALARPWLERAERLIVGNGWRPLEAEVFDLLGYLDADPARLAHAASCDPSAIGAVRRRAVASLVAQRSGDTVLAKVELAAAKARADQLQLGRDADASQWIERAAAALR